MSAIPVPSPSVTVEDYFQLDDRSLDKWEFHNGKLVAMSGTTLPHSKICASLSRQLGNLLERTLFSVFDQGVRVGLETANSYYHPDVTVVCGAEQVSSFDRNSLTNPILVVEVLSESTAKYDMTQKFEVYTQIESLRSLIYVEQTRPLVILHEKTDSGIMSSVVSGLENELEIPSLGIKLSLEKIYDGIEFSLVDDGNPIERAD